MWTSRPRAAQTRAIPLWPLSFALATDAKRVAQPPLTLVYSYLVATKPDGPVGIMQCQKVTHQPGRLLILSTCASGGGEDVIHHILFISLCLYSAASITPCPAARYDVPVSALTFDSGQCFKGAALCPLPFDLTEVYFYNCPCRYQMHIWEVAGPREGAQVCPLTFWPLVHPFCSKRLSAGVPHPTTTHNPILY